MDGRAYYKLSDGKLIGVSNRTDRNRFALLRSLCQRHFLWFQCARLCRLLPTGRKNFCVTIKISFISFISAGLKKTLFLLVICWIFCTFAVQKNIIYLCLKPQDLMVARSSRHITFRTSSRCQPGWNWRPFCSTIPPCHISPNRSAARFFRQK